MKCRVCRSENTHKVGALNVGRGHDIQIFDCAGCGCRFVEYDISVYEDLHQNDAGYLALDKLAVAAKKRFDAGDRNGLRKLLSRKRPAWKFLIDRIESLPDCHRVLEIGCARGALGAYFILAGYDYVGADVSITAVESASARFGQNFVVSSDLEDVTGPAFDAAFHSGTIGCVEDPKALTNSVLDRLRDGGHLLFNAPSVDESRTLNVVWHPTTNPPDLVTLFPLDYWQQQFPDADVRLDLLHVPRSEAVWRQRRASRSPQSSADTVVSTTVHESPFTSPTTAMGWAFGQVAHRSLVAAPRIDRSLARLLGASGTEARLPTSFGVHVDITKASGRRDGLAPISNPRG